eukprot:scaffold31311_cov64-Phaeocystis_antarctica.AAC.11
MRRAKGQKSLLRRWNKSEFCEPSEGFEKSLLRGSKTKSLLRGSNPRPVLPPAAPAASPPSKSSLTYTLRTSAIPASSRNAHARRQPMCGRAPLQNPPSCVYKAIPSGPQRRALVRGC